jgi:glycosyltransferase involved in cell wall biosynthesis
MVGTSSVERIAYLSGPVDAVEAYYAWRNNWALGYFGDSHVTAYIQLCSELGIQSYIITTSKSKRYRYESGGVSIENVPEPRSKSGISYHVEHILWAFSLLRRIIAFRPQIFVITAGVNYWFIFWMLCLFNVKIVTILTCNFWPKYKQPYQLRKSWRVLLYLNTLFMRNCVSAVIGASADVNRQAKVLLQGRSIPVSVFLPLYNRARFAALGRPAYTSKPFRVFFGGRIETNKGVFDLVAVAQRLQRNGFHDVLFDICGDGSKLKELREQVQALGLSDMITCHGFCERPRLVSLLQEAHVVIVPTTTECEEGFNMVCAEAILASRPLITSPVCPALEYVKEAAVEVRPDDVNGYYEALVKLARDQQLYEAKVAACRSAGEQFYDAGTSWKARLREVVDAYRAL